MWLSNRAPVVKVADEAEPLLMPIAVPLEDAPADEFDAYLRLAEKIGAVTGAVTAAKIRRVLACHSIPIYPYADVDKYLRRLAIQRYGRRGAWGWSALRQRDVYDDHPLTAHVGIQGYDAPGARAVYRYWGVMWQQRRYHLAVPYRVLQRVDVIAEAVPEAHFYVSDIQAASGCPFLGVTAEGMEMLVIDQWDEPGFGFPVA